MVAQLRMRWANFEKGFMNFEKRKSVKVLLLNEVNKILLILVDDPKISPIGGKNSGPFWCMVGGGIESGETIQDAAIREIYEETGILEKDILLGPVVWQYSFDFIRSGVPTNMQEIFIVARTKINKIKPANLTEWEKASIKDIKWFSLDEIKDCKKIIYPIFLAQYLPDILAGHYPEKIINLDLK